MINTTLPVLETELDEAKGELIRKTHDIKCKIDVSVFAERRWEENFPANAKTETIFAYVERMNGKDLKNPAYLLSYATKLPTSTRFCKCLICRTSNT